MPKGKEPIRPKPRRIGEKKSPLRFEFEIKKRQIRGLLKQQIMQKSWQRKHTHVFHKMLRQLPQEMQPFAHELLELRKATGAIKKLNALKEQLKAERQTDNLIKFAAVNYPERGIRFIATAALSECDWHSTIPVLKRIALKDIDSGVRHQAVWSLKNFGSHSKHVLMEVALTDPDVSIRIEALKAIGEVGSAADAAFLKERSEKDESIEVRAEAKMAGKKLLQKPPRNI